jgi:polysaccharide export outer membrane protein
VIQSGDVIRIPSGEVGVFYLGGNVNRPGTYDLTGRQLTLKQAIISAGGLGILAWPERCEIIRRVGRDREKVIQLDLRKIFEYKDNDFYLKADDIVMVGTHAVAQFLAAIRNGFRLSYGFGFVYDRNFATIDTYSGQGNPEARRRLEEEQRFPGLF